MKLMLPTQVLFSNIKNLPLLALALASFTLFSCSQAESPKPSAQAEKKEATQKNTPPATPLPKNAETATFAAGCFWCVEAIFESYPGVLSAVSGYAGGSETNPTYPQVSQGKTSHAEVVQVTFDPSVISYKKLLSIFWKMHDITDPRGVAPDFGTQYRSALYYHSPEQHQIILSSKKQLEASGKYNKPIITEIAPLKKFWKAEDYHQDYVQHNPNNKYVAHVAIPKLLKYGYHSEISKEEASKPLNKK